MGNKSSRVRDSSHTNEGNACRYACGDNGRTTGDQERATPLHPPALHEDVAWAIAMSFFQQLHTRVALVTDPVADDFAMVKSYEWIQFDVADESGASMARMATITWFWLSCCPGYSGVENPQFWKRVFCELGRPFPMTEEMGRTRRARNRGSNMSPDPDNSITDAIRFFDHPDRPFPRVQMSSRDPIARQVLFGLGTKRSGLGGVLVRPQEYRRHQKLRAIWNKLQPFVSMCDLQRPIHVMTTSQLSRTEIDKLNAPQPAQPAPPPPRGKGKEMLVPPFVMHSVVQSGYASRSDGGQKKLMCHEIVNVSWIRFVSHKIESATECAVPLRAYFGVAKTSIHLRGRIHILEESRASITPSKLAAICSILPHSQSIHTFRCRSWTHPIAGSPIVRAFELLEWAWLGYAIFHPHANASKWCKLDFYFDGIPPEGLQVLRLMATGNHLASVENNRLTAATATSSFYHTAQVDDEGCLVRSEPTDGAEVLLTLESFSWVCLCVETTSALATWARVVAPGLGLGWIKSSSITEIVSRPPGTSCVQSLRLQLSPMQSAAEPVAGFLAVVGNCVSKLELIEGVAMDASVLRAILLECPALRSLRVQHNGSLWAGPLVEQLPRLEQLWLTLSLSPISLLVDNDFHAPGAAALASCLRDLTEMRVSASPLGTCSQQTKQAIMKLLESHPALRYFHCSDNGCRTTNRRRDNGMFPYVDGCSRSQEFFDELSPRALHGSCSLSLTCKLAFLSAIHRKNQRQEEEVSASRSALGRLDRDVASQIFGFATSLASRDLWFGGD